MQSAVRVPAVSRMQATQPVSRAFTVAVEAKAISRKAQTQARHARLRQKLSGTPERPRLAVYRSNENIYAQVIDDTKGQTLAAASTLTKEIKAAFESGCNSAAAEAVGKKIAELCAAKNITKVAFDRGGNIFTGRVKAVAEAARAGGLQF